MIWQKEMTREDVSPFLSVFLYCPAILFICECACVCVVRTYSRPYGRRQITAWTSPSLLPLQILGLNAEAKKKRKKKNTYTNEEGKSSDSAILCVLYLCTLKYTLSHLLMLMI